MINEKTLYLTIEYRFIDEAEFKEIDVLKVSKLIFGILQKKI